MLETLGIVFLVIIGLVAALIGWVGFKIYRLSRNEQRLAAIRQGFDVEPVRLEVLDEPVWLHADRVNRLAAEATGAGAMPCGAFAAPAAGARLLAFSLFSPRAYLVIYDHDQVEPWIDVFMRLDGERSFTASNVPEIARGAPRPPEDEIQYFPPGTPLRHLVAAATEQAIAVEPLPAEPDAFREIFEAAANRSQEYARTQSVSQEWLEKIASDAGIELSGDEAEHINLDREAERYSELQAGCLKTLAESGDFTAAEWEELRDRLVAVWDGMPDEYVPGVIYEFVDLPDEFADDVDELETGRAAVRDRIAAFNARLPADRQLVRVGTVSSPVTADIYRGNAQLY